MVFSTATMAMLRHHMGMLKPSVFNERVTDYLKLFEEKMAHSGLLSGGVSAEKEAISQHWCLKSRLNIQCQRRLIGFSAVGGHTIRLSCD